MNSPDSQASCTICGQYRKEFDTIHGALICKSCLGSPKATRLEPLKRYGTLVCETGGTYFKPFWLKAQGKIKGFSGIKVGAVFTKKGFSLPGKDNSLLEIHIGPKEFNNQVRIETTTNEITRRFLKDPVVMDVLSFITIHGGRVVIDGNTLEVRMSELLFLNSHLAYPLRTNSEWGVGILFSRLALFYNTCPPGPDQEE
jgi:hypothetical protein